MVKVMLGFIKPQLATLKPKAPVGSKWIHEIKYDGYRLQIHINAGRKKVGQSLLAFDLGKFAHVPVFPEEVECVELNAVLPARREFSLEFGEVGPAVFE